MTLRDIDCSFDDVSQISKQGGGQSTVYLDCFPRSCFPASGSNTCHKTRSSTVGLVCVQNLQMICQGYIQVDKEGKEELENHHFLQRVRDYQFMFYSR